jgi:hypothetical protein
MLGGSLAGTNAAPFTYQGRLVDGTLLGNGSYELTFRLFDSVDGGAQVGSALVLPSVGVTNGLFTVELDFGPSAFPGSARWLELSARTAGAVTSPETLAPRQAINAVPYALRAFAGSGDASELTTGTVPDGRLGPGIARTADLAALNAALSARLSALESAFGTLSNQVHSLPPGGVAAVSSNPADPSLTAAGWTTFSTIPAPAWSNGSSAGAPTARSGHTAVWTGQSWLVWGGTLGGGALSVTGAGYNPATDQWTPISELNPPVARTGHSAVWTGTALLVWGGWGGLGELGTGAAFSPATGNWTALPTAGAPAARRQQVGVWTGARFLVWGGRDISGLRSDGGLLNPDTVSPGWSALPDAGAPEARMDSVGIWAGGRFVVWGGKGALGEFSTGGVLPVAGGVTPGVWTATSAAGAPTARTGHTMVWTGTRVLVWGGEQGGAALGTGASFDPVANTWTSIPTAGAPAARSGHIAVWTGQEMLIFGGQGTSGVLASGGAYDPVTGSWRALSSAGSPVARARTTGAWTGNEFLVFGGTSGASPVGALQRLNPQPTWYFFRKP